MAFEFLNGTKKSNKTEFTFDTPSSFKPQNVSSPINAQTGVPLPLPLPNNLNATQGKYEPISLDENSYVANNPGMSGFSDLAKGAYYGFRQNPLSDPRELIWNKLNPKLNEELKQAQAKQNPEFFSKVNQINQEVKDFIPQTSAEKIGSVVGNEVANLPLWLAGEGAIGAVAGKVVPKLGTLNKLPGIVKGGLKDAATYGAVVAPAETLIQGGDLNTLAEKEKTLPLVFGGGVALRGIGQGVGRLAKNRLQPTLPKTEVQPLNKLESLPKLTQQDLVKKEFGLDDFIPESSYKPPKDIITGEDLVKVNPIEIKDVSNFTAYTSDPYRIIRQGLGEKEGKRFLNSLDQAKKSNAQMQETLANELKSEIVDKLGIKPGSKESSLVQKYGEGIEVAKVKDPQTGKMVTQTRPYTLDNLKLDAPDKWENIVKADEWFRNKYNTLIDITNESKKKIYPYVENRLKEIDEQIADIPKRYTRENQQTQIKNIQDMITKAQGQLNRDPFLVNKEVNNLKMQLGKVQKNPLYTTEGQQEKIQALMDEKSNWLGQKLIPKRQDYYRHFQEMAEGFKALQNILHSPAQIDPKLVGVSDFTAPKSKWASIAQKREGQFTEQDAVRGFLDYLPQASYATHIDPQIARLRQLEGFLRESTETTKNANVFIEFIKDYADSLAGKTNFLDRGFQKLAGRKVFNVLNWMNSRVKANVVLGKASSALAQLGNIPQGMAFAKQHSFKGIARTIESIKNPNSVMMESAFLKDRYGGAGSQVYRQFDEKLLQQPKNFAIWLMEVSDRTGTTFIWNSAYEKAIAEKILNPIQYADDMTRNLVGGRGIGETPLIQQSRVFQMLAPFQLEVANLWRVQKDFITRKDFGGLVGLYLLNRGFNELMEQTRGSGVVFDPIDAIYDAATEKDLSPLERGGRVAGEIISNVPLGQTLAGMYPEYGAGSLPTRKQLFGRNDPTRFGSSVLIAKGVQDPLYKLALPFGGEQVKKTKEGIKSLLKGGVYADDKLKYPVEKTPQNVLRGALFGQSSYPEAREYYDLNRRPLSEDQTKKFEGSLNRLEAYGGIMKQREIESLQQKIKDIQKDKKMTDKEKYNAIGDLQRRIEKLQSGG